MCNYNYSLSSLGAMTQSDRESCHFVTYWLLSTMWLILIYEYWTPTHDTRAHCSLHAKMMMQQLFTTRLLPVCACMYKNSLITQERTIALRSFSLQSLNGNAAEFKRETKVVVSLS